MICVGIEGTAHSFSVGVVKDNGEILSCVTDMYKSEKGGMIPNEVADHHREVCDSVFEKALEEAGIKEEEIGLISFSQSPGLAPCLLAVLEFAKKKAKELDVLLVGINHIVAHLEIGKLITNAKDPVFVFISGANTQIIALEGGKYRIFGETLDMGLGNALDKFGREAGLGFPAGPRIEELANKGEYVELPYSVKGMDVCFSGIITKAKQLLDKGEKLENICYSLQETLFAMVVEVTERAMAHCDKKESLVIGGVAANKRFSEMLDSMCKERDAKAYAVPLKYAGDNGAMIAWQGILEKNKANKNYDKFDFDPRLRVDQVEVDW